MTENEKRKAPPTPESTNMGGGGKTGPNPALRDNVVSGDRNTGEPDQKKPKDGPLR